MPFGTSRASIAALALVAVVAIAAPPPPETDDVTSELVALQPFLDNDELDLPMNTARSSACSVRLLSSALRYRRNPNKYRNDFFSTLVIDDYVDRAAGKYNYVNPDAIAATLDSAMAAPDRITDNRTKAVIGFCTLKDKNLWVVTRKSGRISLARIVRGLAVSSLLEGTDENPLAITNAIDAHTAASHGSPGQ